jgi:hypothetical protein
MHGAGAESAGFEPVRRNLAKGRHGAASNASCQARTFIAYAMPEPEPRLLNVAAFA